MSIERAPARVLVYGHRVPSVPALCEALANCGVQVRAVNDFQELCAWLVCWRGTTVALVAMPGIETFREAVIAALHRIDPGLPIAPLDPARTVDSMMGDVERLLAADHMPVEAQENLPFREAA